MRVVRFERRPTGSTGTELRRPWSPSSSWQSPSQCSRTRWVPAAVAAAGHSPGSGRRAPGRTGEQRPPLLAAGWTRSIRERSRCHGPWCARRRCWPHSLQSDPSCPGPGTGALSRARSSMAAAAEQGLPPGGPQEERRSALQGRERSARSWIGRRRCFGMIAIDISAGKWCQYIVLGGFPSPASRCALRLSGKARALTGMVGEVP